MFKKLVGIISIFLVLSILALVILLNVRPRPEALENYELGKSIGTNLPFTVNFLGNTNLLFNDGENAWMTDAFFTRPSTRKVLFGKVEPDEEVIRKTLEKAGIEKLDMIVPVHSHFDHAMDAAMVADFTGATLFGSSSTINIGKGYDLDEGQMLIPKWDSLYAIGKFEIQFIKSRHWQYPDEEQRKALLDNKIEEPLTTPASIMDYKEGDSYTILVLYDSLRFAIQGSAGYRQGSLPTDFKADVLFLAIAGLETMDVNYKDEFQEYLINPLQPKVLVPIHWDDFTTPLGDELKTTNLIFNWKYKSNLGQAFKAIEVRNPEKKIKVLKPWERYNILDIME